MNPSPRVLIIITYPERVKLAQLEHTHTIPYNALHNGCSRMPLVGWIHLAQPSEILGPVSAQNPEPPARTGADSPRCRVCNGLLQPRSGPTHPPHRPGRMCGPPTTLPGRSHPTSRPRRPLRLHRNPALKQRFSEDSGPRTIHRSRPLDLRGPRSTRSTHISHGNPRYSQTQRPTPALRTPNARQGLRFRQNPRNRPPARLSPRRQAPNPLRSHRSPGPEYPIGPSGRVSEMLVCCGMGILPMRHRAILALYIGTFSSEKWPYRSRAGLS